MTRNSSGVKKLNQDTSANCYPLYFDLKCHTMAGADPGFFLGGGAPLTD